MKNFNEWMNDHEQIVAESVLSQTSKMVKEGLPEGWKTEMAEAEEGGDVLILSFENEDKQPMVEIRVGQRGDKILVGLIDLNSGAYLTEPMLAPPMAEDVVNVIRYKMDQVPYNLANKLIPLEM